MSAASTIVDSTSWPTSGARAVLERDQQRNDRVQAGERIAGAARDDRRPVGEAGEPRHAGDLLHRLREADAVAPRTVEAEGGHAHHDEPRVCGGELLVDEAEVVHDARREVLDRDVGDGEQALHQIDACRTTEVERDATLAEVDRLVERAPLPPFVFGRRLDALEAHAVGALDRFDLDDVGTHRGEVLRDERAGPEGGEVDDAQAGEGPARYAAQTKGRYSG